MAKGICFSCVKSVGGMFQPIGFKCPDCKKVYCGKCCKWTGTLVKVPVCPTCIVKLKQ